MVLVPSCCTGKLIFSFLISSYNYLWFRFHIPTSTWATFITKQSFFKVSVCCSIISFFLNWYCVPQSLENSLRPTSLAQLKCIVLYLTASVSEGLLHPGIKAELKIYLTVKKTSVLEPLSTEQFQKTLYFSAGKFRQWLKWVLWHLFYAITQLYPGKEKEKSKA